MYFRRPFVGRPGRTTLCASTFQRHVASRRHSVDVVVHRYHMPLAVAERPLSLRVRFWMTRAHHRQSIHAGARVLAGYQMPSTCRASISRGRAVVYVTKFVNRLPPRFRRANRGRRGARNDIHIDQIRHSETNLTKRGAVARAVIVLVDWRGRQQADKLRRYGHKINFMYNSLNRGSYAWPPPWTKPYQDFRRLSIVPSRAHRSACRDAVRKLSSLGLRQIGSRGQRVLQTWSTFFSGQLAKQNRLTRLSIDR